MRKIALAILLALLTVPSAYAATGCTEADLIGLGINAYQAEALGCDSLSSNILPSADNTYNLGSASYSFKDAYVQGTLYAGTVDSATCTGLSANITFSTAGLAVVDVSGTNTADLCIGAETTCAATTGSFVNIHGIADATAAEVGLLELGSGNVNDANADIALTTGHAAGDIVFSNPTGVEWSIDSTQGNIVQGAQGGNITLLTTDTGVVATTDAVTLKFAGGSDDATANGAFLTLDGDDKGGADTGVGAVLNVGNNTAAKLSVVHNATEVLAVNSVGALLGAATLNADVGTTQKLYTFGPGGVAIAQGVDDANDSHLAFYKSDATDGSANTAADSGDDLGSVDFYGADGDTFALAARILVEADAATGDGDMPGRISFQVSPDAAEVPATALLIGNDTSVTFSGTLISSSTTTIGWHYVDGADNTACESQCTAGAVFGVNLAAGASAPVLVNHDDASADACICAGAS